VNPRSSRAAPIRDRLRAAVTAEILDAAEAVIAANGVAGASIAAIARRAGVAVGTLYNYFPDRDAIVAALFRARRTALSPRIRAALPAAGGFEARLAGFLRGVLAAMDDHRAFVKIAVEADHRPPPDVKRGGTLAELRACFAELLEAGITEGVVDPDAAELAGPVMTSALKGVMIHQLAAGEPFAAQADRLTRLFLDGARRR